MVLVWDSVPSAVQVRAVGDPTSLTWPSLLVNSAVEMGLAGFLIAYSYQ